MRPPNISLDRIIALAPPCLSVTVPQAYRDENGHMNMRWYLAIFDDAGDTLHQRLGLTPEFHQRNGTGTVDLEHHVHYLSEVMPGERVTVYARVVAHSAKRVHCVMFMVNETKGRLASIFECMNAFADMRLRKTAPFPPAIEEKIAAAVAADASLDWPAPVCGSMRA